MSRIRVSLIATSAIAASFALGLAAQPAAAQEKIDQTPTTPEHGAAYPVGTPFTGPCVPGNPPSPRFAPRTATKHDSFRWSSFTVEGHDDYPHMLWTQVVRPEYDGTGPCATGASATNRAVIGNGVPGFRANEVAKWTMHPILTKIEWGFDDQGSYHWYPHYAEDVQLPDKRTFDVYHPCVFMVSGVAGRVLIDRPGKQPQTVRRNTVVMQGDILVVQRDGKTRGRVTMDGGAGNDLGFGEGEYRFSDHAKCKELVKGRYPAKLPTKSPDLEVKEGKVEQKVNETGSIVKAAKDLWNEGIFSKLGGRSAAVRANGQTVTYSVQRNRKRKTTRSCAKKGKLRVTTKSKRVPKKKRSLVLGKGQCAVTKDGRAPRRVG